MELKTQEVFLEKTLNEFKREEFDFYTFLRSKKISFEENKDSSLKSLGEKFGFNSQLVFEDYKKLTQIDFEDKIEFENLSNEVLVEYLLKTHHAYLKKNIPLLISDGSHLLKEFKNSHTQIIKIVELFDSLLKELLAHIEEEEKYLFPLFLEKDQSIVANKLKVIEIEHEESEGALKQLNLMCDGFNCPFDDNEIKEYYQKMHEFSNKLYAHINIEKSILFPRISR